MEKKKNGPGSLLRTICLLLVALTLQRCQDAPVKLNTGGTEIQWEKTSKGWKIAQVKLKVKDQWQETGTPSGEFTILYSKDKPDSSSTVFRTVTNVPFPEPVYKYQIEHWKRSTAPVALNTAGEVFHFYPSVAASDEQSIRFRQELDVALVSASWTSDPRYPTDVIVNQTLIAKQDGYYSMATPSLITIEKDDIAWATVPGYFQGRSFQDNFVRAYAYGQGIPTLPVIYPERCASTLSPIVSTKEGVSVSVNPAPGLARDPWKRDQYTHQEWIVGLSHMNRKGELSPTLYYPVLGQPGSKLQAGDTLTYAFRFSLIHGEWYHNLEHVANDIYRFDDALALRENKQSLTARVEAMHRYLTDRKTSLWNIESFDGTSIGGQSYLGGVIGSNGDAMKNSDYGAMWMLARATGDPVLSRQVLPYALNFKLAQQQVSPGFFKGAAIGQYYLAKSKKFVEEWGEFVEPVSLTYYTMLDVGNILLFEPNHKELIDRLRLGADLLLKWQKPDGSWEVAYDRRTEEPLFTDIKDLRPTFYGLLVAYRILGEDKYLDAARKGADWLIDNGVANGHFIGVCGDARYAPDFATAQTAQTLLDLYEVTGEKPYRDAAVMAARFYTTSVYTHPVPSAEIKRVNGVERRDWEISQSGLSFEHGGIMGSAQRHGPIQLASHAGLFVRMFQLTKDSLFLNMARSAAIGRDAFVDSATSVASYYWNAMNKGAGPYPHHAWWQIGWITDYILAEAALRSGGKVDFPRGFVTPKVGPHQSYGFEPGTIFNEKANLVIREGLVTIENPNIEYVLAEAVGTKKLFVILLNDLPKDAAGTVVVNAGKLYRGRRVREVLDLTTGRTVGTTNSWSSSLTPYGLKIYAVEFQ